jgi:chromosome segregation ATPase
MGIRQIVRRVLIVLPPVRRRAAYLTALNAERDLLQYRLDEARQQLDYVEAEKAALFENEQRLRSEFASESTRFRQDLEASREALRESNGRHRDEAERSAALRQDLTLLGQQVAATGQALEGALKDGAGFRDQADTLSARLSDAQAANIALAEEVATLRGERLGLNKVCEGQRVEIRTLGLEIERQAAAARREAGRVEEQRASTRFSLDRALVRAETLSREMAAFDGQIARLEAEVSDLRIQNAQLTATNAQLDLTKSDLAETLSAAQTRLVYMAQERAELDNRMHNIGSAIASAEAERDALQARLDAAVAGDGEAQAQLAKTVENLRTTEARHAQLEDELKRQVDAAQAEAAGVREHASDRLGALGEAFEQRIAALDKEIAALQATPLASSSKARAKTPAAKTPAAKPPANTRRSAAKSTGA